MAGELWWHPRSREVHCPGGGRNASLVLLFSALARRTEGWKKKPPMAAVWEPTAASYPQGSQEVATPTTPMTTFQRNPLANGELLARLPKAAEIPYLLVAI